MKIGYFTPPQFKKRPFDIKMLDDQFERSFKYASKGRYCLFHILKSMNIKGPVLLPVYCCSSILEPIKRLKLPYQFYDINEDDFNADLDSIYKIVETSSPDCIIAVSMYGNPCCLPRLEELCHNKGIVLIDDAAQSFGAEIEGKRVGTFGDAGFFSLSPGKPNAGHMGGFFWTSSPEYKIKYKKHPLLHRIVYKDFCFNRLNGVKNCYSIYGKCLKKLTSFMLRKIDIAYDYYSRFEDEIIGGVLCDSIEHHTPVRTKLAFELNRLLMPSNLYKQLLPVMDDNIKGIAHKYVLSCSTPQIANEMIDYLKRKEISCQKGYRMLSDNLESLPHAKALDGRAVEIPLDPNHDACQYIAETINEFVNKRQQ